MACRLLRIPSWLVLIAMLSASGACGGGETPIDAPGGDGGVAQTGANSGTTGGSNASTGAATGSSSGTADTSGASAGTSGVYEDAGAGAAVGNANHGSAGRMSGSVDSPDASAYSGGTADSMDGPSDGSRDGSADGTDGTTEVCTSGVIWQGLPGPTMDPGDTCPSCHSSFQIAGTIYPTADEPTDCEGVSGSNLSVVITDANGNAQTLAVNASGNFYSTKTVVFPFHAKVISKTAERDMVAAQSTGDCNYCHTPMGLNGAPGRIMSP